MDLPRAPALKNQSLCANGPAALSVEVRRGEGAATAPIKTVLSRAPRAATVILTTADGTAWTEDASGRAGARRARRAGIPDGLTFHDLRATAITRPAEASCEVPEIAAIAATRSRT